MLANCNDLLNKNGRNGVIGVTLLGLTAYAERIDKLRESCHGWQASFRRCRDASFGSDSKFGNEPKGLSTPLGRLGASKGEDQRPF